MTWPPIGAISGQEGERTPETKRVYQGLDLQI